MNSINVKKFGMAFGITAALLYLGCILFMTLAGQEVTVAFFNSLLHGLDTSSIIRMNIPWWESLIGIAETFVLAWLAGICIAAIYNTSLNKKDMDT